MQRFVQTLMLVCLLAPIAPAKAESDNDALSLVPGYHQHLNHFHTLEKQLTALEHRNPANHQFLTVGTAVILDLALELVHATILQQHSPDYFYQRPFIDATGLEHTSRDLFQYVIAHGHIPALLMGAGAWVSENFGELPNLYTGESLLQIGILAGAIAGGYNWLYGRTMLSDTPFTNISTNSIPLFARLHTDARKPFLAAMVLNRYKNILQAAAIAIMVVRSFLIRQDRKSEIEEVRAALTLAREQLLLSTVTPEFSSVIPAQAGIYRAVDPRLRGGDEDVRRDGETLD